MMTARKRAYRPKEGKPPFRIRNYRSSLARFLRWKLRHTACFACSVPRAPVTCMACKRSHCPPCCYRGLRICMNCMLQQPNGLYRVQDVHKTFKLDWYAPRRSNTRRMLQLVRFLAPCHVCYTTGLHRLCIKCTLDTCDACLHWDSCRCQECGIPCSFCEQEGPTICCLTCERSYCLGCMGDYDTCIGCDLVQRYR